METTYLSAKDFSDQETRQNIEQSIELYFSKVRDLFSASPTKTSLFAKVWNSPILGGVVSTESYAVLWKKLKTSSETRRFDNP